MIDRGQRLQHAMLLRGFHKQHALAHLLGVAESAISRWKKNGAISVDHAIALCAALDISLDWFLRGLGPVDGPEGRNTYPLDQAPARHGFEEHAMPAWVLQVGCAATARETCATRKIQPLIV